MKYQIYLESSKDKFPVLNRLGKNFQPKVL